MSELLKLADRVEALEGPDRNVDLAIAEAIGSARVRNGSINISASVTASLDAAISLMPEGKKWNVSDWSGGTAAILNARGGHDHYGYGATPALALCAAALRARAALSTQPFVVIKEGLGDE